MIEPARHDSSRAGAGVISPMQTGLHAAGLEAGAQASLACQTKRA